MSDDASTTATGSDTATGSTTATGPDTAATPDAAPCAQEVLAAARAAKDAQPALVRLTRQDKDALLTAMADALVADAATIVAANAEDLERADAAGMDPALRDRLALDADRVAAIAQQLRDAAALPDPVGEVVRGGVLANGLELRQVRVPLGVVGMIYEARPNVTVDAAGLALKSGNAVVLRGGSAAISSNTALIACLRGVLAQRGLPEDLIVGIDRWGREGADVLMRARGLVDVLIPRGGAGLIRRVVENSIVPVIETGTGNTHILIDATADLDQALEIIANAKTQRIGVCNALETLLVHEAAAVEALPRVAARLAESGVTLHADEQAREILAQAGTTASVVPATEEDWDTEYLSLDLAVRVVPDVEAAIAHIRAHSSGHTESILTRDIASQRAFLAGVDSAVVMVNASTRFSDGGEFGFGAEIGISTQKLHARGPMALPEMTATKYIVTGRGQTRA